MVRDYRSQHDKWQPAIIHKRLGPLSYQHSGSAVRIRAARIPAVITPDVKTAKRGYAVMVTLGRTIDILKRWHTDKSHACNEKLTLSRYRLEVNFS